MRYYPEPDSHIRDKVNVVLKKLSKLSNRNIVKISDNKKRVYSGYRTVFDGGGSWNFVNDEARSVTIFDVDKSSSFMPIIARTIVIRKVRIV